MPVEFKATTAMAETLKKPAPATLAETPVSAIELVDELIETANARRASDIHIDPRAEDIRVRFRVDGLLTEASPLPKRMHEEVIARIKVLSRLRTDEHQSTQDGRFRHELPDRRFLDLRVSIAPTYHGENAVIRLLSDKAENFTLRSLGFSEEHEKKIRAALKRPNGMILSTGPTGSGKTTTLYTLLQMLNSPEVSIVTIEDPIEYAVENIEQIQVSGRSGLTFANGLRSILRQDPDVIMVGEIRDKDTANIAVTTALTGHILLSTLHTNDAAATLPRLLDMGIEEYLVASTVSIVIGQRLVRKICPHCRTKAEITKEGREILKTVFGETSAAHAKHTYRGEGCAQCGDGGYSGRIAIYEVLVADEEMREAIIRKAPASEIRKLAMRRGMKTMLEDGLAKAGRGETTIEEVLRATRE
jgi:type II secretory ATPase GspE/PulE/Tfp pilus assembly ATPase PilB-like protein